MSKKRIGLCVTGVVILLISVSLITAFRGRKIVVASDTTYLTSPLADDGLPDYNSWLTSVLMDGVTPENNAAVPLWQAVGSGSIQPEDRVVFFAVLQMPIPAGDKDFNIHGEACAKSVREALTLEAAKAAKAAKDADAEGAAGAEDSLSDERAVAAEAADVPNAESGTPPREDDTAIAAVSDMGEMGVDFGGGMFGMDGPFGPTAEDVINDCQSQPWTRDELPAVAKWIDDHLADYDLLHQAAAKTKFGSPSPTLLSMRNGSLVYCTLPHQEALRIAIRNLSGRAMLRIGEGQYKDAWDDCRDMFSMAGHVPADSLVGALVGVACRNVAIDATLHLLNEPLDSELAKEIEQHVHQLKTPTDIAQCLDDFERLFYVTSCLAIAGARESPTETSQEFGLIGSSMAVDWNGVLRQGNKAYDEIVKAFNIQEWKSRQQALKQVEDKMMGNFNRPKLRRLLTRGGRTQLASDVTFAMMFPGMGAFAEAVDRERVRVACLQITASLVRHRIEHNGYPESIDVLQLPASLRTDYRHGLPYVYQRTGNGFLLYGLGANGTDEDGTHARMNIYRGVSQDFFESLLDEDAPAEQRQDPGWREACFTNGLPQGADDEGIRMPPPRRKQLGDRPN